MSFGAAIKSARRSAKRRRGVDGRAKASRPLGFTEDPAMSVGVHESTQTDWVQSVLFDRGYLSRIRGEAIKVYLVVVEAGGGEPDRSVTISLNQLTRRTKLSTPTVIDSLVQLEKLGLVVSTTHQRGKVKTYYIADPPAPRAD